MKIYRRMRISLSELDRMRDELDDYVWIALDLKRSALSAGDEYIGDLRDVLLQRRSAVENIYCVGLNMATGDINFLKSFNRRNPKVGYGGDISDEVRKEICHQIEYFFAGLPIFEAKAKRARRNLGRIMPALGQC
jgi:hypothetical protein